MEPLTPEEVRVLGCLAEKQLATPQHYPLTEAALVAACNQSTNRDPVVSYDQAVVRPALISLREQGLAKRIRRAGERVEKHAHRLEDALGLAPGPVAVLTVLLLRGPQTPGELKGRTERLHRFADGNGLDAALADLADRGLAEQLVRRPGEKQVRWRHLLGGEEPPALPDRPAGEPTAAHAPTAEAATQPAQPPLPTLRELAAEVAALRARVHQLEQELGVAPGAPTEDAASPLPAEDAAATVPGAPLAEAPILDPDASDEGPSG